MKLQAKIGLLLFLLCANVHAELEERSFTNSNIGVVQLNVPKHWKTVERHHIRYGTTFYRLVPADNKFDIEFIINDLEHMRMGTFTDKDLERYVETNLASYVIESVEKKVLAKRFGKKSDGVYARLTDGSDTKEKFLLLTQGARLFADRKNLVLFFLKSNDKDNKVLDKILAIAESIRLK